jgi:hypothetical protein
MRATAPGGSWRGSPPRGTTETNKRETNACAEPRIAGRHEPFLKKQVRALSSTMSTLAHKQEIIIIAGPNGKTSLASEYLSSLLGALCPFERIVNE